MAWAGLEEVLLVEEPFTLDFDEWYDRGSPFESKADVRDRLGLKLAELRPGFVYEFRLKNLAPANAEFHPAEAYYTLRAVPE